MSAELSVVREVVDQALCRTVGRAEDWFPEQGGQNRAAAAIEVCGRCPVSRACLELALAAEVGRPSTARFGIYGGTNPAKRAQLDPVVQARIEPERRSA